MTSAQARCRITPGGNLAAPGSTVRPFSFRAIVSNAYLCDSRMSALGGKSCKDTKLTSECELLYVAFSGVQMRMYMVVKREAAATPADG